MTLSQSALTSSSAVSKAMLRPAPSVKPNMHMTNVLIIQAHRSYSVKSGHLKNRHPDDNQESFFRVFGNHFQSDKYKQDFDVKMKFRYKGHDPNPWFSGI